jgi:hypothetical protein
MGWVGGDLREGVGAAVVDQDQLGRLAEADQHGVDLADEVGQVIGLVVKRNDDGEKGVHGARGWPGKRASRPSLPATEKGDGQHGADGA